MRLLITGVCGFVGSSLALLLSESISGLEVVGLDNLWRPGSETNRQRLRSAGVHVIHGDLRCASDLESLPPVEWVLDAAANASVLAGVDGATTPRQLLEHNLIGTVNLLEYCRRHVAGLVLLSSSRIYRMPDLRAIPLAERDGAFVLRDPLTMPGVGPSGITEAFPAGAPASLYGVTKLASELLALEYGETFGFPVWVDRCGVLSGAGQFGQPGQGVFAWWVHRWARRRPLRYLGFGGRGLQVRDCLHPEDLATLVERQLRDSGKPGETRVFNVSGGSATAMSLAQLSQWCADRFGHHDVAADEVERPFDLPWVVLDSGLAECRWQWRTHRTIVSILGELADHAESYPNWLELSEG